MPKKTFLLDDGTEVDVYKSRLSRNLKISLGSNGKVRVSIPTWAPYSVGINFAKTKQGWIKSHLVRPIFLYDGQPIGKTHNLVLAETLIASPKTQISQNEIKVEYPIGLDGTDSEVQVAAKKAAIKGLRKQAQEFLPKRLAELSNQTGLSYNDVKVRVLKGRWGSCDSHRNVTLNIYLMQLPWELIDYVLIHELSHTVVMKHGPEFWNEMDKYLDDPRALKKQLQEFQPTIG